MSRYETRKRELEVELMTVQIDNGRVDIEKLRAEIRLMERWEPWIGARCLGAWRRGTERSHRRPQSYHFDKPMKGGMLTIPVVGAPTLTELTAVPTLDALQAAIGGYLEAVPGFDSIIAEHGKRQRCVAFCDEDGKLKGLPVNQMATQMWSRGRVAGFPVDVLCGVVVVVYGDKELLAGL